MSFEKEKKEFLAKKDKSRKGSIDGKIRRLVNKINSLDDFFTTSSCSGRIMLFSLPKSNKKNEVQYLFCSHKKIRYNDIKKTLKNSKGIFGELGNQRFPVSRKSVGFSRMPKNSKNFSSILKTINTKIKLKNDIWFRMGGAILHVASNNMYSARKLLNAARDIGFRRSGIISLGKNRVTMELVSTENIEAIVSKKGRLVIGEDYLRVLIKEGNKKLEKMWKKIDKLCNVLDKIK